MRSIWIVFMVLVLSGCFSHSSSHKVEITGSPDDVSRFIAAEKSLDPDADVDHIKGQSRAVFSATSEKALDEIAARATDARLTIALTSNRWSIESTL